MTTRGVFVRRRLRVDPQLVVRAASRTVGHDRGMAEWAKNSYGAYLNIDATTEDRIIIFLLRNGNRSAGRPTIVACLDFVGMTQADYEVWEDWGSPEAAGVAAGTLAGHGTGGKAYMWHMFEGDAYLLSVKDGYQNIRGFQGNDPRDRIVPGQFGQPDLPVPDAVHALDEQLRTVFGLSFSELPERAQHVVRNRQAYTFAIGEGPKDVNRNTIPVMRWLDGLQATGQMFPVLESCKVYVYRNETLLDRASPMQPVDLTYVDSRVLGVPVTLPDPQTGFDVPTRADEQSELRLRMCDSDLVRSRQGFNKVFYWAADGMRGETPLQQFTSSGWGRRINAALVLDSLNPMCVSEERLDLVDNELSRAVKQWLRDRIEEYVDGFDELEAREEREEDRRRNVQIMDAFNEWKNQFLDDLWYPGGQGAGTGGSTSRRPPTPLPRRDVARIRIAAEADTAGVDVVLPFTVHFLDENDQRVRPIPVSWEISDWNVCSVDEDERHIRTNAPGVAVISVVTSQGIRSNAVQVNVLDLKEIEIRDAEIEIRQGERRLIHTRSVDRSDAEYHDVRLVWVSNSSSIAEVGEHGFVTGVSPGQTQVYAMDGYAQSVNHATVTVTPVGGDSRRYPELLLSEEQQGPYEQPARLRPREGPVVQRAQDVDYNIWWMNKRSSLANHILSIHGVNDPMWLQYVFHCFAEMIARIVVQRRVEMGRSN